MHKKILIKNNNFFIPNVHLYKLIAKNIFFDRILDFEKNIENILSIFFNNNNHHHQNEIFSIKY